LCSSHDVVAQNVDEKQLWAEKCGGQDDHYLHLSSNGKGARPKIDVYVHKLISITSKIADYLAEFHYFYQILDENL